MNIFLFTIHLGCFFLAIVVSRERRSLEQKKSRSPIQHRNNVVRFWILLVAVFLCAEITQFLIFPSSTGFEIVSSIGVTATVAFMVTFFKHAKRTRLLDESNQKKRLYLRTIEIVLWFCSLVTVWALIIRL